MDTVSTQPADEPTSAEVKIFTAADVPDALFPSDNEFQIPVLDLSLQADYLDLPVVVWGSTSRKAKMPGTWCFFADDYRFTSLWSDPSPIINSGAIACVEPNFSVNCQMPRVVALYNTYRKRWLARYWQSQGIKIWVDMHVGPRHAVENLLGVPTGWKSYATRGLDEHLDWLDFEYSLAVAHAGTEDINFLVYGGSTPAQQMCSAKGWLWCPALMDKTIRRKV